MNRSARRAFPLFLVLLTASHALFAADPSPSQVDLGTGNG
jgi:hypothetical protein